MAVKEITYFGLENGRRLIRREAVSGVEVSGVGVSGMMVSGVVV